MHETMQCTPLLPPCPSDYLFLKPECVPLGRCVTTLVVSNCAHHGPEPLTFCYRVCAEDRVVEYGHPSSSFHCSCATAFLPFLFLYHLKVSCARVPTGKSGEERKRSKEWHGRSPPWGWSTAFMAAPRTVGLLPRRLARPALPRLIY